MSYEDNENEGYNDDDVEEAEPQTDDEEEKDDGKSPHPSSTAATDPSTKGQADDDDESEGEDGEVVGVGLEEENDSVAPPTESRGHEPTRVVAPEQRSTFAVLSRYERARVLGWRARQISEGSPVLVELPPSSVPPDPIKTAMLELRAKRLPFVIVRRLPDGSVEHWKLSELMID